MYIPSYQTAHLHAYLHAYLDACIHACIRYMYVVIQLGVLDPLLPRHFFPTTSYWVWVWDWDMQTRKKAHGQTEHAMRCRVDIQPDRRPQTGRQTGRQAGMVTKLGSCQCSGEASIGVLVAVLAMYLSGGGTAFKAWCDVVWGGMLHRRGSLAFFSSAPSTRSKFLYIYRFSTTTVSALLFILAFSSHLFFSLPF